MPIFGYEEPWQVRAHLAGLKKERLSAVPGKTVAIDAEIARFTVELERIRDEEKARIKAQADADERAADEAASI